MLAAFQEILKTLRALVRGVDDARLRRRPAPGEWAIIEVVGHLADTEERALARVRRMLAEDTPYLEPFDRRRWPRSATTFSWASRASWNAWSGFAGSTSPSWKRSTGRAGRAPAGTANTASCRLSCTRPTSPPKRPITSPRSPGSCRSPRKTPGHGGRQRAWVPTAASHLLVTRPVTRRG